jgi:hypothetical protein
MLRRQGQRWRLGGAGVARIPELAGAIVTIAAGVVLGLAIFLALAIVLIFAIASVPSLPAPAMWLLLLLAIVAGIMAILHRHGAL